jgi:hypothetical protein
MFPFIYRDSVLYFSSNGHGGLGGLDIYKVALNREPGDRSVANVGYPLNTPNDDFSIIFSEDGTTGYFASNRKHEANDDVYQFFIKAPSVKKTDHFVKTKTLEEKKAEPKAMIISEVKNEAPKSVIAAKPVIAEKKIYYTVQVLALTKPIAVKKSFSTRLTDPLMHDYRDGIHRYSYGVYNSQEQAEFILKEVKAEGYRDAFIKKVER